MADMPCKRLPHIEESILKELLYGHILFRAGFGLALDSQLWCESITGPKQRSEHINPLIVVLPIGEETYDMEAAANF